MKLWPDEWSKQGNKISLNKSLKRLFLPLADVFIFDQSINWDISILIGCQGYLDSVLAQEVGCGVQDVCGVCWVVVGVGCVVISLDHLQPRAHRGLCAVQELTHTKSREDLQPQVWERPAHTHTRYNNQNFSH